MGFNKILKGIILLGAVSGLLACSSEPSWFKPSGSPAGVPEDLSLPFEAYVSKSRKNIEKVISQQRFVDEVSPYVNGYSIADVVDMRSPFQLPDDSDDVCGRKADGAGTGFLLVHGLTDSPYLLKSMAQSIIQERPCALIRAVLLPGHGTVVGDTLNMRHQDWQGITQYGVNSLEKMDKIKDIYIVGFSTGTALAIKHVKNIEENSKIKGLVLLSTALKADSDLAWLTSYLKVVKPWLDTKIERDAARYSSFSTNAGSQFYKLTKNLMDKDYQTNIPVLMAISADDATVNTESAREYFCQHVNNDRKLMLWYQGFSSDSNTQCEGIINIPLSDIAQVYKTQEYRYANVAHTGVPVSPDDSHYGVTGKYRDCKFYEKKDDDTLWQQCMTDNNKTIFAEKNIANKELILGGNMWRRGTFNKDYDYLLQKILCFTQSECPLK